MVSAVVMRRRLPFHTGLFLVLVAFVAAPAARADDLREVEVDLPTSGVFLRARDRIFGDDAVDHLFEAQAGQRLRVRLTTSHSESHLQLYAPGRDDPAITGRSVDAVLPQGGTWRVRVALDPAAAMKGEGTNYALDLLGGSDQALPLAPAPGALANAGQIACTFGGRARPCRVGILRGPTGTILRAAHPDGTRTIRFEDDRATGSDAARPLTQSGGLGTHVIRIGPSERYLIPARLLEGP